MPSPHVEPKETVDATARWLPLSRCALLIAWPAFVMAGVLEAMVFAVLDPMSLHWFAGEAIGWSRSAVYSVTFLIFWGVISASGAITHLLEAPAGGVSEPRG